MTEKKKKKISLSKVTGLVEDIKVENDIPVLERIRYPLIWERISSGYRIQDLQPSKIDNAIEIIKDYYIHEEILCKGIDLTSDPEAVEEYLTLAAHWLKDTQSLAAVEEGTGTVVGVLVGRVLDRTVMTQGRMTESELDSKTVEQIASAIKECPPPPCENVPTSQSKWGKKGKKDDSKKKETVPKEDKLQKMKSSKSKSRVTLVAKTDLLEPQKTLKPMFDDEFTIYENPKMLAMHKFKSYLTKKVDILKLYEVELYYSMYILLVTPEHRGKGVAKALVRSAKEMTMKFKIDVISGIITSKILQNLLHKEEFQVLEEMNLSQWEDKEGMFTGVKENEVTVAVMAHKIVVPEPPPPPPPQHPPRRKKKQ